MQAGDINERLDGAFSLVESGRLVEALSILEQVCRQDAGNAGAWMMQGSVNFELGNIDEAFAHLTRAAELDPSLPESFYYLASIHRARGNIPEALEYVKKAMELDAEYGEAFLLGGAIYGMLGQIDASEQCCRSAVALLPDSVEACMNLGNVLLQGGRSEEACQVLERAAALQPGSPDVWNLLGRLHAQAGEFDKSANAYKKLLDLNPNSEEACYGLGYVSYREGNYEEAAEKFSRALSINPAYTEAANGLGVVYQAMGRYADAADTFQKVLDINPSSAEALFGKGRALIELSRQQESVLLMQQAIQIKPDYIEAHLNLAAMLMSLDRPDEAMQYCDRALGIQPDNMDAIALAARIELQAGQEEEACQRLRPHIVAGVKHVNLAIAYGDVCRSANRGDEAIEVLEALQRDDAHLSVVNRRGIHFCLANLYDKSKAFDKAFDHYRSGNDLRDMQWDATENRNQVDNIIRVFSKEFLLRAPRARTTSEKPVFVLGMPRSGTSLVEQVLASHPAVFGAGELTWLYSMVAKLPALLGTTSAYPDCVPKLGAGEIDSMANAYLARLDECGPEFERVIDKMPGNFSFLGLIELMFPGAKIIHCTRDPVDTCLSCYFQDFAMSQPYSYDLEHLLSFYKDYQRLMAHWKDVLTIPVLEVNYEELVADQEAVSRRLVAFCGLEWDDDCLQFHKTERFVATSSYDQVRQPIYTSSVKRWKNYQDHIGVLVEGLSVQRFP